MEFIDEAISSSDAFAKTIVINLEIDESNAYLLDGTDSFFKLTVGDNKNNKVANLVEAA